MTDYRIVTRHVRYWRGAVHRWSNVYPFTGTIASGNYAACIAAMHTAEQAINYYTGTPPITGGNYEIAMYNSATGGVPVDVVTYFDYTAPGSWIPYTATAWGTSSAYEQVAEVALAVRWQGGLSRTGKPVYFRKWYHSVPSSTATGSARDVSTAAVLNIGNALTTALNTVGGFGAPMGRGGRLASSSPIVGIYYENHQMPRGRRRKALVSASGQYNGPAIHYPASPPVVVD